jgi:hypothetical protein
LSVEIVHKFIGCLVLLESWLRFAKSTSVIVFAVVDLGSDCRLAAPYLLSSGGSAIAAVATVYSRKSASGGFKVCITKHEPASFARTLLDMIVFSAMVVA